MRNDDAMKTANGSRQLSYEIVQTASDPNRPWQLVGKDAHGTEICRIRYKTYGDAWHGAQRRKADEVECQADLQNWAALRQDVRPSDYKADILAWSERQSSLLRRLAAGEKIIDQIDWGNVIDEVESAGRRQLAELKSLLTQALAAMLKAWAWPQSPDVSRWNTEASSLRREAVEILAPTMQRRIDINEFYFKAIRFLPRTIDGEEAPLFPTECPVTLEDLLADWHPDIGGRT
jgi:hypothetical protein